MEEGTAVKAARGLPGVESSERQGSVSLQLQIAFVLHCEVSMGPHIRLAKSLISRAVPSGPEAQHER